MDGICVTSKSEKAKMLAGELYRSADPELVADTKRAQRLVAEYNATSGEDPEIRTALLRQLFDSVGDGTIIRPFFACDYGYNIRIGRNGFINFNCVFLDCAPLEIGDNLQMGPAVQIYTAAHPLEAAARRSGLDSYMTERLPGTTAKHGWGNNIEMNIMIMRVEGQINGGRQARE